MKMIRREFLRKAGLGSLALASLPKLIDALRIPAYAQAQINFHFATLSVAGPQAAQAAGTPASPQHVMVLSGDGSFEASGTPASRVSGGGMFLHVTFPGAAPPLGGTPLPVVASGTWGNGRLVRYTPNRSHGVQGTGVVELVVDLFREVPSRTTIRGAVMKVVCASGLAGVAIPGELEGVTLSIPGTEFSAGGNPGPFTPTGGYPSPRGAGTLGAPGLGITLLSVVPVPQ